MSPIWARFSLAISFIVIIFILCNSLKNIQELRTIYKSNNRGYESRISQHGDYIVWHNYFLALDNSRDNESVTLATHGTYQDLGMLPLLINRWNAPISLTLYVNGDDYFKTIQAMDYITGCMHVNRLFHRFVSLHLCFHRLHVPKNIRMYSIYDTTFICGTPPVFSNNSQKDTYWYTKGLQYPTNLLRNIARMNVHTYFVMNLDIDLIPSKYFPNRFIQFLRPQNTETSKTLYCLVTFLINTKISVPGTKKDLLKLVENHIDLPIITFDMEGDYQQVLWLKSKQVFNQIRIFTRTDNDNMCIGYVSINEKEPLSDERFEVESVYDSKNLKMSMMSFLNYEYIILDEAFLLKRESSSWDDVDTTSMKQPRKENINKYWQTWAHFYIHILH